MGCLLVILFMIISGAIAGVLAFGGGGEVPPLKANTILKVDASMISEIVQDNPFNSLLSGDLEDKSIALSTAISAIKKAKNNPNITALYLNVEYISAGMASIDALRRAIEDFGESGKPIIAYALHPYSPSCSKISAWLSGSFRTNSRGNNAQDMCY